MCPKCFGQRVAMVILCKYQLIPLQPQYPSCRPEKHEDRADWAQHLYSALPRKRPRAGGQKGFSACTGEENNLRPSSNLLCFNHWNSDKLGPGRFVASAAVLFAPGQTSPPATEKLYGTKNNCVPHSWGKFCTKDTKNKQKTWFPFLKSQEQKQGGEAKPGYWSCPLQSMPLERWANTQATPMVHPLETPLTPYKEEAHFSPGIGLARESVNYFCSLL